MLPLTGEEAVPRYGKAWPQVTEQGLDPSALRSTPHSISYQSCISLVELILVQMTKKSLLLNPEKAGLPVTYRKFKVYSCFRNGLTQGLKLHHGLSLCLSPQHTL